MTKDFPWSLSSSLLGAARLHADRCQQFGVSPARGDVFFFRGIPVYPIWIQKTMMQSHPPKKTAPFYGPVNCPSRSSLNRGFWEVFLGEWIHILV